MKRFLMTTILGLGLTAALGIGFIPSAACADCEADNLPAAKKAFTAFDDLCKKQLADGKDQTKGCFVSNVYNKVLPALKNLAKDNRFGPGDRILFVGEAQNGNLVAGANRTFLAGSPSPKNTMTVEVNKTNGDNGAKIKICAIDDKGNVTRVGTIDFAEKAADGVKSANISGIEGKIIQIEVASFGGALRNFKYTLTTKQ